MKIRCPACDQQYEDNGKERRIIQAAYTYHVCPPCYLAYLKVRVTSGAKLNLPDLYVIGQVRKKVKG